MHSVYTQRRTMRGTSWEHTPRTSVLVTWDTLAEAEACLAMIEWHIAHRHVPGIWRFSGTRYWIEDTTGQGHKSSTGIYNASTPEFAERS